MLCKAPLLFHFCFASKTELTIRTICTFDVDPVQASRHFGIHRKRKGCGSDDRIPRFTRCPASTNLAAIWGRHSSSNSHTPIVFAQDALADAFHERHLRMCTAVRRLAVCLDGCSAGLLQELVHGTGLPPLECLAVSGRTTADPNAAREVLQAPPVVVAAYARRGSVLTLVNPGARLSSRPSPLPPPPEPSGGSL